MKVELVDHMGNDLTVVNAARVSFDKHAEIVTNKDEKLIKYLSEHNHWTPFGHCSVSFRVTAPIFVARQLGKHQVGLVWNEVSRRYVDERPTFYIPGAWRERAVNAKQGSGTTLGHWKSQNVKARYGDMVDQCLAVYEEMLMNGVCPEQARMVLPQSMNTEWIWTGSLVAFARVCKLRMDPHTQQETRSIAHAIDGIMHSLFPLSWKALINGS